MLVYVFWHWRRREVERDQYELLQRDFQSALRTAPPPGLVESWVSAVTGAAWAAGGGEAYEDWYLIEGSWALDPLNDAAVTGGRQAPHAAAAAAALGGVAGLYRLRRGTVTPAPRVAAWFPKPPGLSYEALYDLLQPLIGAPEFALWGRQMVLGPAPEFCLCSTEPVALPAPLSPITVSLRTVWRTS